MKQDLPKKRAVFQYSFLALPLAFAGLPLYVHAPDFYVRDIGVNLGLIGVVLLFLRLFDAVQDPVIGYFSDKYASKRFQIIALGSASLIIGMGMVFYGPHFHVPPLLWFSIAMVVAATGFSIVTINLNMIGGFWHDDPKLRTKISAWRESAALVGLLIASVMPAALQIFKPAEDAFRIVFWVFCILMVAGMIMFTRFMRRISPGHRINQNAPQCGLSFFHLFRGRDKHFFTVCFLTHLSAAMPGVMVLFFINDYLGAPDLAGLFLFLYFMSGALLISFWVKLAARLGKYQAWLVSMVLAVASFIWAFTLSPGDVFAYGVICVCSGMALGADLSLPPSILADRIDRAQQQDKATQYYAMLAFLPKMAIAIASGVSFIILDQLGFVAGGVNTPMTMTGLLALYTLVPCGVKLLTAFLLWRFYKTEGKDNETMERNYTDGSINNA